MPRLPTGRPVGRRPRPHTVSLRIPADLHAALTRYAAVHRQRMSAWLLDGLRWRLSAADPRDLAMAVPRHSPQGAKGSYGPPAVAPERQPTPSALRHEMHAQLQPFREDLAAHGAQLAAIGARLQVLAAQLAAIRETLQPRPMVQAPRSAPIDVSLRSRGVEGSGPQGHRTP